LKNWAVIDIGSNTIRLVIYKETINGSYKEVENVKAVARLRQYLNSQKVLEQKGTDLCLSILEEFKRIIDYHKVKNVKCVATATIRQAVNKSEILLTIKENIGFEIKVLSEQEEAYLGYLAVVNTTAVEDGVTIDIGGGSTEITYFQNKKLIQSFSFPFGVVSLKERYMKGKRMSSDEKEALQTAILEALHTLPWLRNLKVPIIAIGGSARNIAQVHQNLSNYPLAGIHQYEMKIEDLTNITTMMENMDVEQLEKLEGLSKDRADIIIPALEVFVLLSKFVNATNFVFSKRGLRDGLIFQDQNVAPLHAEQIMEKSIHNLVVDYGIEPEHSNHVADLATQMYGQLCHIFGHEPIPYSQRFIKQSACIYYIGQYVDADVSSHHTFNLLAHQSIDGFTHKERLILALIASFKNWSLLKQYSDPFPQWVSKDELKDIRIAGAMVKLASSLDSSKRGLIKKITVQKKQAELLFQISSVGNILVEKYQAEKQVRHLEKALKYKIQLNFIQMEHGK